jgi:hypothetical protein
MKIKTILVALAFFPLATLAETTIVSEILVGKSQHEIKSSLSAGASDDSYSAALDDTSVGFRFGVKFWDNVSIELAKHDHGSAVNEFTIYFPTTIPGTPSGGNCCLGPDHDYTVEARIPVKIESIRFGVKGEIDVYKNFTVNARLGVAYWSYDSFSPQQIILSGSSTNRGESGNDIYYSIGGEYQLTENLHLGLEYSLFTVSEKFDERIGISGSYEHDIQDLSLVLGWKF